MGFIKRCTFLCIFLTLFSMPSAVRVSAWSNGGFSTDPAHPDYGTHDWIAHHALDWLPTQEKSYILDNLTSYLYGTELPDNDQAGDGIGDTRLHHVYYNSSGALTDDAAAVRASTVFGEVINHLRFGNSVKAAKYAGIMSHYIVDLAVFGHVMGSSTDWGAEKHHDEYETYVNQGTSSYDAEFNVFLSFDGNLTIISAYNATIYLAYDTTFDLDGDLTCVWMDQNYNWSNPTFMDRCGESLNLAVNLLADVLHTLYVEANAPTPDHVVINEFEQNPPGKDAGHEWVELYNPTTNDLNISGWMVTATHGEQATATISEGTFIAAREFYVVTYESEWLDNENEVIVLRDANGNEVDKTLNASDTQNDHLCWARYPNGQDADLNADWRFQRSTRDKFNGGASQVTIVDHLVVADGITFHVVTESNSTVSGFNFTQELKRIAFNVTGSSGSEGFCNTTIPKQLLGGPFIVQLNGVSISFISTENSTHTFIYFAYAHSQHRIEIVGSTVIPEFPVFLIPMFIVITIIAMLIRRRLIADLKSGMRSEGGSRNCSNGSVGSKVC